MTEIIFSAPDADFLASEAARLGFATQDGKIIVSGAFAGGGGWFLNVVGVVYEPVKGPVDIETPTAPIARPGYWGRLRINGVLEQLPPFSSLIVQYTWSDSLGGWTADGRKLGPVWVGDIGLIA